MPREHRVAGRRHWPRPAGCARRRRWRWSPGRACAPNSCRARSAAARRRAPAATRAWPRLRHRRRTSAGRARRNGRSSIANQSGNSCVPTLSSRKLARAVQRAAGHRAEQVADQPARHLRREQHRVLAGARSAAASSRATVRSAARRPIAAADSRSSRGQRDAVPAVALHAVAAAGDQRAADASGWCCARGR